MGCHNGKSGQGGANAAAATPSVRYRLVSLLRQVGDGTGAWPPFLDALAAALRGAAAALAIGDGETDGGSEVATSGIEEPFRHAYAEHYAFHDAWVARLTRRPAGTVGFGYETLPGPLLRTSRFYAEWMQPQRFAATPTIHAVVGSAPDATRAVLSIFRRLDGPTLEIEDLALIRSLMPELHQSVAAYRARHAPGSATATAPPPTKIPA
jgi:hypothetical protein